MNLIYLTIGTILIAFFIILLIKGEKYDYMLESLSGDAFPFDTIYTAGLALQDFKFGKLRGKIGDQLRFDTTLFYSKKFSEFYSRIIWAQALSFTIIIVGVFFLLAAIIESMSSMLVLIGVLFGCFTCYYFLNYTKDKVSKRQDECDEEFPNAISKLALIVNSGVILRDAWEIVAEGKDGEFYDLMKLSCDDMRNGKSDVDAIHDFGVLTNSEDIKKFTSALIQSIERGGGDLPQFLVNQSSELWARKRQVMLQKGEKAAGALLMPIALMFLGVMMIVISAAMQSFSL